MNIGKRLEIRFSFTEPWSGSLETSDVAEL